MLTSRQTAVLAAIERRGFCTLIDLRQDFPTLAPSTVLRVIDVLHARALIGRVGDPKRVYRGGVQFYAQRRARKEAIDVPV